MIATALLPVAMRMADLSEHRKDTNATSARDFARVGCEYADGILARAHDSRDPDDMPSTAELFRWTDAARSFVRTIRRDDPGWLSWWESEGRPFGLPVASDSGPSHWELKMVFHTSPPGLPSTVWTA